MTVRTVIPRRPPLRDRDVELAGILGSSPLVRLWRERLPTVRVARVQRFVRDGWLDRQTWWDVRLEADDGWNAEGEIIDVEPLIDIERISAELSPAVRDVVSGGRVRRLVRWLLWDEIWVARDRLSDRLMDATLTEVP